MRKIFLYPLALSLGSFSVLVRPMASEPLVGSNVWKRGPGLTAAEFSAKLSREGFDHSIAEATAEQLGFDHSLQTKFFQVSADNAADNRVREAYVVLEGASDGAEKKPVSLIFLAKRKSKAGAESAYFRLSPEGALEKAFMHSLKYDEDGKAVPGSGSWTPLPIEKKDVKAALSYELDFWLRDKHRAQPKKL